MEYQQEKQSSVSELKQNYDEYNQYMKMIGNMLGVEEDDDAAGNNEPEVKEEEEEEKSSPP